MVGRRFATRSGPTLSKLILENNPLSATRMPDYRNFLPHVPETLPMAMFPTHIKCSTLAGIGCGTVACVGYGVPLTTSMVGAGLCSIGGILPDIDSGPGIPLREITTFLASVVPTMLITRLLSYSFTQETLILAGAVIYVAIRFGLSHFLREYTVHRGMFHSIPSMAIFGEMTYLLFYGESMFVRLFMVAAVCWAFSFICCWMKSIASSGTESRT